MSNFIINTKVELEKKSSLISDLIDIHTAITVQKGQSRSNSPLKIKKKSSSVRNNK